MSEIHKIFCTNCGEQIEVDLDEFDADTVFCINCGTQTDISDLRKQYSDDEDEYSDDDFFEKSEDDEKYPEDDLFVEEETAFPSDNSVEFETQSPFKTVDVEKKDNINTIHIKETASPQTQSVNPFESISEDEKNEIENRISGRVKVWHDAIKTSSDNRSEFTDNFAHGMPDWDLTPPDMLIRRKAAKPADNKR